MARTESSFSRVFRLSITNTEGAQEENLQDVWSEVACRVVYWALRRSGEGGRSTGSYLAKAS